MVPSHQIPDPGGSVDANRRSAGVKGSKPVALAHRPAPRRLSGPRAKRS